MHTSRRRLTHCVAAAVLALGLVGCSGDDQTIITDDGTVSVQGDEDGNSLTIDSSEGSVTLSAESDGELPRDWPANVALPEGGTINSSASFDSPEGQAWQVSMSYPGTAPGDLIAQLTTSMQDEGFTVTADASAGGQTVAAFAGDGRSVTAAAGEDGSGETVMTVVIAPEAS
jgi:hypothetical protein